MPYRALLLALALLACTRAAAAQDPDGAGYGVLLARLQGGDTNVDYRALRLAYARTPGYAPYATDETHRMQRIRSAADGRDFVTALMIADTMLAVNYTDIDAHVFAMYASSHIGDDPRSRFHRAIVRGLVDSIMNTASGDSPSSPYVVISVDEEYAALRVVGLRVEGQGLADCAGGHQCDQMEVVDADTGARSTLYFDVSIPMQHLAGELEP
jgi:Domain of unknown function (DUF4919)